MIVLSWVMTLKYSVKVALLFLIVIPLLGGTLIFIAKKAHPHFIKVFDEYDILNNSVQENVKIMKSINSTEFPSMYIHCLQKQKRSLHGTHQLCSLQCMLLYFCL